MKKILALLLSIMMLATFVPMMALAETAEDTTDILTSRGLDYTVYEADPGDLTPATLTEEALLAMTKEVGISGTKRNYVDAPPYIRVDLGKKCEITSILSFSGGSVYRGVVTAKYSVDGLTWYDLSTSRVQYNRTAGANTYNSGATYANNFIATEPVVAKYLEITLIGYTSDKSVQHNMINIYGRPLSATKLSSLTVENATLGAEFDADVQEYSAEISSYENMPVISATAETEGAEVSITQATAETMKATVAVSYAGEATRTYTINFTVPELPAPTAMKYMNGVLSWGLPEHANLGNVSGEYYWNDVYGEKSDVPYVQVDVYDANDALVDSLDINHEENNKLKLTRAFYLDAYIEEAGTYKVSAALKTEDGTLGEKAWIEGVVIDALSVVSLPEKGATAVGKHANETEEKDVTEQLLSSEVNRGNYYGKDLSGYVIITLPAPAKVESIMAHQQGYRVRGTYSYSLDGVNWTPLTAGTDITVPGNGNNFVTTYSSSGYTFIPVVEGKEFVAQYIKYEHPSLSSNFALNQIYVNGEFVDVNYGDIALTQADGKITATVSGQYVLNNTPATNGSAVLFTATYKVEDGKKVLVSISDRTTIKGYALAQAVAKSVEVNAPTEAGTYVVKAFLFNNMSAIVPLVAAPEITITVQ